jgi:hypothetical protein
VGPVSGVESQGSHASRVPVASESRTASTLVR